MRQEIIREVAYAKQAGIAKEQTCTLLQINVRRILRWETRMNSTGTLAYAKPGPQQPVHAIVPTERAALRSLLGERKR